jgi:hypothetical protein
LFHLFHRHILLLRIDERPDLIALGASHAQIPHVRIVEGSTGASGILQQAQDGVFPYSEHPASRVNGVSFNQGRYDLTPFGCV